MAQILSFFRKPARRAPVRGRRAGRAARGFSIEVMPRTAAKVEDFRAILPAGTRVYLAHIDGTDFAEMLAAARRLADEGFAVMPHFPARGIAEPGRARRPGRRLCRRRRARGAGDRRRHRHAARAVRRGDAAAARPGSSTRAASPACTSPAIRRATATSTPPAATANAMAALAREGRLPRETDAAMAIATQFCFDAGPAIAWAERLRGSGHHAAGAYRRRRAGEAADA